MPVPDLIRDGHRFSDKIMLHLKQTILCGSPFQNARFAPRASRSSTLRLPPRSDIETRPRRSLRRSPATWRSGYAAVCKTVYAGSIPAVASTSFPRLIRPKAGRSGILPGRWRVTDGSSRRGPTGQFMLPCDIDFAAMRETTVFMLVYQSYMEMEQEQACPGDQK